MSKVIKCDRCKKRMRNGKDWNATFKAGVVVGHLCPHCQTAEETLEAMVNEATIDYTATQTIPYGLTEEALIDLFHRSDIDPAEYNVAGLVHAVNQGMADALSAGVPVDEPSVADQHLLKLTTEKLEEFYVGQ